MTDSEDMRRVEKKLAHVSNQKRLVSGLDRLAFQLLDAGEKSSVVIERMEIFERVFKYLAIRSRTEQEEDPHVTFGLADYRRALDEPSPPPGRKEPLKPAGSRTVTSKSAIARRQESFGGPQLADYRARAAVFTGGNGGAGGAGDAAGRPAPAPAGPGILGGFDLPDTPKSVPSRPPDDEQF